MEVHASTATTRTSRVTLDMHDCPPPPPLQALQDRQQRRQILRHDEQENEEHYDERSDAENDLEKGRLKFPPSSKLYGRDVELERLQSMMITPAAASSTSSSVVAASAVVAPETAAAITTSTAAPAASLSSSRVVFLPGYSGTGKSALVHAFIQQLAALSVTSSSACSTVSSSSSSIHAQGAIAAPRFISCKFEELFTSEAYSAIANGINHFLASALISYTVSSNDHKNDKVPSTQNDSLVMKLHSELKEAPGILVKMIPSLSSFLNRGEDTSQDSSSVSSIAINSGNSNKNIQNNIKHVLQGLIKTLCSKDHPLILFLDDLQWIDEGSMDLLSSLLSDVTLKYFMLIGAYRSNEVGEDHSLSTLLQDLSSSASKLQQHQYSHFDGAKPIVVHIELADLTVADIDQFLVDTLHLEHPDEARLLSEELFQTTLGNIFFTKQALEELHRKNGLYYDVMCFKWEWNLQRIQTEQLLSDDVVIMVQSKIRYLPLLVQRLLTVFALLRRTVNVATLYEV
jgi:predicted ATPase